MDRIIKGLSNISAPDKQKKKKKLTNINSSSNPIMRVVVSVSTSVAAHPFRLVLFPPVTGRTSSMPHAAFRYFQNVRFITCLTASARSLFPAPALPP